MENNEKDPKRKEAEKDKAQNVEQNDANRLNTSDPIEPTTPTERSRHFNETLARESPQDDSTIPGATPLKKDKRPD